ncbi:MAG: tetratricopeptide repeat protein [Thermodesulfovibrionales bacterium]|nr:tetratricopeptide repeat protein [Thermodesulfovibrionales bacterium]
MLEQEEGEFFRRGLEALERDQTVAALSWFEKAIEKGRSPSSLSFFAFCIARQRGQYKKAISFCLEAIQKDPNNSLHYLNLGKIYLLDKNKTEAIKVFREGMHHQSNAQIIQELEKLGPRKPPVIPFLKRNNPLNKYLGIILSRLKLR